MMCWMKIALVFRTLEGEKCKKWKSYVLHPGV